MYPKCSGITNVVERRETDGLQVEPLCIQSNINAFQFRQLCSALPRGTQLGAIRLVIGWLELGSDCAEL